MASYLKGYTQTWIQPFLTDNVDNEPREREDSIIEIFNSVSAFCGTKESSLRSDLIVVLWRESS